MIKFILRFLLISSLVVAIVIGGAGLYMKFHGKTLVESALSSMVGLEVKYKSAAIDIDKGSLSLKGVTVADRMAPGHHFLKIEKLDLAINKNRFIKEKIIVVERARLDGAALALERAKNGSFNIRLDRRKGPGSGNSPFDILGRFKEITIVNSKVMFTDYRIARKAAVSVFYDLNAQFRAAGTGGDVIRANCSAQALIPSGRYSSGTLAVRAGMAIYKDKVNLDAQIDAHSVDITFLCPYINKYTPFIFRSGLFSSASDIRLYNNSIYSPTTVIFHAIDMSVKPYAPNALFLNAGLDKLVPYLESRRGDLIFDFYLQGTPGNIKPGVGPRVSAAIGMATQAEMMKILQQLQRLQY